MSKETLKTIQSFSGTMPRNKDKDVGVMLVCNECSMMRMFKINTALKDITDRKCAGLIIKSQCEGCGKTIGLGLGWMDSTKEGYSYREFSAEIHEKQVMVKDSSGLDSSEESKV